MFLKRIELYPLIFSNYLYLYLTYIRKYRMQLSKAEHCMNESVIENENHEIKLDNVNEFFLSPTVNERLIFWLVCCVLKQPMACGLLYVKYGSNAPFCGE